MSVVAFVSVAMAAIAGCFFARGDKALGFFLLAVLALTAAVGAA